MNNHVDAARKLIKALMQASDVYQIYFMNSRRDMYRTAILPVLCAAQMSLSAPRVLCHAMVDSTIKNIVREHAAFKTDAAGRMTPEMVDAAENGTCLVIVEHANRHCGTLMDIAAICATAHKRHVPVYVDCSTTYDRWPTADVPDIITMESGGVSCVMIKTELVDGYCLQKFCPTYHDGHFLSKVEYAALRAGITAARTHRAAKHGTARARVLRRLQQLCTVAEYGALVAKSAENPDVVVFGEPGGLPMITFMRIAGQPKRAGKCAAIKPASSPECFAAMGVRAEWCKKIMVVWLYDCDPIKIAEHM